MALDTQEKLFSSALVAIAFEDWNLWFDPQLCFCMTYKLTAFGMTGNFKIKNVYFQNSISESHTFWN